jgi:hypothetical protein
VNIALPASTVTVVYTSAAIAVTGVYFLSCQYYLTVGGSNNVNYKVNGSFIAPVQNFTSVAGTVYPMALAFSFNAGDVLEIIFNDTPATTLQLNGVLMN